MSNLEKRKPLSAEHARLEDSQAIENLGAGEGKLRARPVNVEMISLFARD
jgi:hypothetical protein